MLGLAFSTIGISLVCSLFAGVMGSYLSDLLSKQAVLGFSIRVFSLPPLDLLFCWLLSFGLHGLAKWSLLLALILRSLHLEYVSCIAQIMRLSRIPFASIYLRHLDDLALTLVICMGSCPLSVSPLFMATHRSLAKDPNHGFRQTKPRWLNSLTILPNVDLFLMGPRTCLLVNIFNQPKIIINIKSNFCNHIKIIW